MSPSHMGIFNQNYTAVSRDVPRQPPQDPTIKLVSKWIIVTTDSGPKHGYEIRNKIIVKEHNKDVAEPVEVAMYVSTHHRIKVHSNIKSEYLTNCRYKLLAPQLKKRVLGILSTDIWVTSSINDKILDIYYIKKEVEDLRDTLITIFGNIIKGNKPVDNSSSRGRDESLLSLPNSQANELISGGDNKENFDLKIFDLELCRKHNRCSSPIYRKYKAISIEDLSCFFYYVPEEKKVNIGFSEHESKWSNITAGVASKSYLKTFTRFVILKRIIENQKEALKEELDEGYLFQFLDSIPTA